MSKKRPVQGSHPEEGYEADLEDALMLDEPGMIVEPDVRKALLKYFKDMKMLEGTYLAKSTKTHVSAQQREATVKITKRQLRQIIHEALNPPSTRRHRYVNGFDEMLGASFKIIDYDTITVDKAGKSGSAYITIKSDDRRSPPDGIDVNWYLDEKGNLVLKTDDDSTVVSQSARDWTRGLLSNFMLEAGL